MHQRSRTCRFSSAQASTRVIPVRAKFARAVALLVGSLVLGVIGVPLAEASPAPVSLAPAAPGTNLLTNPDFQTAVDGLATDWTDEHTTASEATYSLVTTGVAEGEYAQNFVYSGVAADNNVKTEIYQAPITVSPGQVLTFSIYLSGTIASVYGIIGIESFLSGGTYISEADTAFTVLTSTPTQYVVTYTCPPGASYVAAYLQMPGIVASSYMSVTMSAARLVVTPPVTRVYGTDAIATSIAVSQADFPKGGSADAVVLARSDFFSDALAGGPLAAKVNGPLLISPGASSSSSLDPRVLSEIQRVLPTGKTVYVLGGDLALSPNIDATLEGLGYSVVREAGADEYATAVDVAEQMGNPTTIFEATGLNFYDSISAVPAAVESQGAILLTDGTTQAPETAAYLSAHSDDVRYAIGGPLAAAGADPGATAVYGQDLYGTSAAVANHFFTHPTTFGAATSATFSDALSGGPGLGLADAPLLLVPPSGPLPSSIEQYLSSVASGLTSGTVYGGPLAVGSDVFAELEAVV